MAQTLSGGLNRRTWHKNAISHQSFKQFGQYYFGIESLSFFLTENT